jgi:hypothetical protein
MTEDLIKKPNNFARLNLLDSKDISDVLLFTKPEIIPHAIKPTGATEFDYYTINDLKYAHEWPHPHFGYTMHNLGFRFSELPEEVDIAVFGCSFTFGLGLPEDKLWHSIVSKNLGMTCVNFGLAGSSVQTIIDVFLIVSKHVKIKKAVFLFPPFTRYQVARGDKETDNYIHLSAIPSHKSELCTSYGVNTFDLYKSLPHEELFKNSKNAIYLAEHIAKLRDIKIFYGAWEDESFYFISHMNFEYATLLPRWFTTDECQGDLARDQQHPGIKHHAYWASMIERFLK